MHVVLPDEILHELEGDHGYAMERNRAFTVSIHHMVYIPSLMPIGGERPYVHRLFAYFPDTSGGILFFFFFFLCNFGLSCTEHERALALVLLLF